MKNRQGFVSNSSSSSFILPIALNGDQTKIELSIDDISHLFNGMEEGGIRSIIKNVNDLNAHYIKEFGRREETRSLQELLVDQELTDEYDQYVNLLSQGKCIIMGSVDYSNEMAYRFVTLLGGEMRD
jgi:hypothetical protein